MTSLTRGDSSLKPATAAPARGWVVIADRELRDLWLSARGPSLVLVFSLLLSVLTYLAANNEELNLLDQKDTVNLVIQITLGIGVAVSLLLSADALSGERERETLESLLLTPIPRRHLPIGKLLAAVSVWPVLVTVAVPYVWALRAGTGLFADAVVSGFVVGTLLTAAFASLGMMVSTISSSNRVSLAVSFFVFVVLLAPTQLPLKGWLGDLLIRVNPVTSGARFIDRVVVSNHGWGEEATLLVSPILAALIALTAVAVLTGHLRLHGGIGT